ncbi:UNVERIFIED_ORG: hypothetical protein J2W74_002014 [Methylorubrum zatmanii]
MRNTIDTDYGFSEFIRDYGSVYGNAEIDYESLVRKYFTGELDEFVEKVEFDAVERGTRAENFRIYDECEKIMLDLLAAARHCPDFVRDVFMSYGEGNAESFLGCVGFILREKGIAERLEVLLSDRKISLQDRQRIARVIEFDFEAAIEGRDKPRTVPAEDIGARVKDDVKLRAGMIDDIRRADPAFLDAMLARFRSGEFRENADASESAHEAEGYFGPEEFRDGPRSKLTVAEARRRVMAHTGQSERSIIRETKGWTADKIIALIA